MVSAVTVCLQMVYLVPVCLPKAYSELVYSAEVCLRCCLACLQALLLVCYSAETALPLAAKASDLTVYCQLQAL